MTFEREMKEIVAELFRQKMAPANIRDKYLRDEYGHELLTNLAKKMQPWFDDERGDEFDIVGTRYNAGDQGRPTETENQYSIAYLPFPVTLEKDKKELGRGFYILEHNDAFGMTDQGVGEPRAIAGPFETYDVASHYLEDMMNQWSVENPTGQAGIGPFNHRSASLDQDHATASRYYGGYLPEADAARMQKLRQDFGEEMPDLTRQKMRMGQDDPDLTTLKQVRHFNQRAGLPMSYKFIDDPRTDIDPASVQNLVQSGHLTLQNGRVIVTPKGQQDLQQSTFSLLKEEPGDVLLRKLRAWQEDGQRPIQMKHISAMGFGPEDVQKRIEQGYLALDGTRIILTPKGEQLASPFNEQDEEGGSELDQVADLIANKMVTKGEEQDPEDEPEDPTSMRSAYGGIAEREGVNIAPMIKVRIMGDKLPGGYGDSMPDDLFDPQDLAMGIEWEMEHTDDPALAKEIAKDHLTEDPEYYTNMMMCGIDEALDELLERKKKRKSVELGDYWSIVDRTMDQDWPGDAMTPASGEEGDGAGDGGGE